MRKSFNFNQNGYLLVGVLALTMFMAAVIGTLSVLANANLQRTRERILVLEAQYAAESGADAAIAQLNADQTASYTGTGASQTTVLTTSRYKATFQTSVAAGSSGNEKVITSTGRLFQPATASNATYTRKIEVTTQRTSSEVASTGMLSRNIIEIASAIKNVQAPNLYANGYINTNKNSTTLTIENITVADKNTGATNCSIGGPATLAKPTSFSTPGQTKVNITVAYNNCINPPGNTSNANFNVAANQNNITKIQSTYIPWSQYMDNTYQNSPTGCNDWTSGSSPHTIPSTGNTKKTHYPDSGSGVSTSCGTSGDISLGTGTYNIADNVHIRANLCVATQCDPVFNNTSGSVKYIFVEGDVNFDSVTTASGSSPIVLVVYGSDPASKVSVCPYGGALYLGNGNTNAPQMYFLAMNGLCFDKSKFSSSVALGGLSGKNIYLSTNSGTPFDPDISSTFPTSAVPVDLSWHAARYRRL